MTCNIINCFRDLFTFNSSLNEASNLYESGFELFRIGRYKDALPYFEKTLEINFQKLGKYSIQTAKSHVDLGEVYSSLGKYDEAHFHYLSAFKYYKKTWGENHKSVPRIFCDLGLIYYYQGETDKALEYYNRARDSRIAFLRKDLGAMFKKDDLLLATVSNLKAWVLDSQGKHEEAIQCYHYALEAYVNILGLYHPDVASLFNNMGLTYSSKGEYERAVDQYKRAIMIFEKNFGGSHPRLATSYNNLGAVLVELGRVDEAENFMKKALEIDASLLGDQHPNLIKGNTNLGSVYLYKKDFDQAMVHFMISISLRQKIGQEKTLDASNSYDGIGSVNLFRQRFDEGKKMYQKSLVLKTKHKKENDQNHNNTIINYKALLFEIDKARDTFDNSSNV